MKLRVTSWFGQEQNEPAGLPAEPHHHHDSVELPMISIVNLTKNVYCVGHHRSTIPQKRDGQSSSISSPRVFLCSTRSFITFFAFSSAAERLPDFASASRRP
jgi:hypothetical protein